MPRYFRRSNRWGRNRGLPQFRRISRKDYNALDRQYRDYKSFRQTHKKNTFPRTLLTGIYNSPSPFPKTLIARQSYSEVINMTVGAGGLFGTEKVFMLNSMYDPDYDVGGHQPYARDQLAQLYHRYKVLGVFVDVTYYGASTNTVACGVKLSPEGQIASGVLQGRKINEVAEVNNCQVKYLTSTGSQKTKFKAYFPMWKLLQITKLQFKSDSTAYDADVGGNPIKSAYMRLAIADSALGSVATANCAVTLTFVTLWHSRTQLAQS